jgi:2-oxo-4-hydroxy-4-carboxy-5-ureidoimidazoline decarboxylase
MSLQQINTLNDTEATATITQCCSAQTWVQRMVAGRPYASAEELQASADRHWRGLSESDYLQAFDGHPKIGDVGSLKTKYASSKTLAEGEQAQVSEADEQLINDLAQGNHDYLEKFGFIFIVFASGKSAQQMLALLQARIDNSRASELVNACEQQRLIFQRRLEALL